MSTVLKQTVGIDCGSQELVVSIVRMFSTGEISCIGTKAFPNTHSGFGKLLKWSAAGLISTEVRPKFIVEATGVYHEKLAYFLVENNQEICIVLPNKITAYAKTCISKQQDDFQASRVIAEFGCVKKLDSWRAPDPVYRCLKQLTRERDQLQREHSTVNTQYHSEVKQAYPSASSVKRMKMRMTLLKKQIADIEEEIAELIDENPSLKEKISQVSSIPGVGKQTVITIIAETNGFNLIRNYKQLVSYAGYDVIKKTSGISVRGRAKISKKGNSYIRKAMHFPAFSAVKHNETMQQVHQRIIARQSIKMKGYVAVQRKLLILIYTLWKNNQPYKFLEQRVEAALTELD